MDGHKSERSVNAQSDDLRTTSSRFIASSHQRHYQWRLVDSLADHWDDYPVIVLIYRYEGASMNELNLIF